MTDFASAFAVTGTNNSARQVSVTWTNGLLAALDTAFAAGVADGSITLAKQANVATGTVFYRKTAGAGSPEVQTLATLKTDLGLTGTNSGDQDLSGYSLTSHNHSGVYQPAGSYAASSHNHDGAYQPAGSYAAAAHDHSISDTTGLQAALDGKQASGSYASASHSHSDATTGAAGFMPAADKTKLDGIASNATANSSDATLLNRANHTGTQAASTLTGTVTLPVASTGAITSSSPTAGVGYATGAGGAVTQATNKSTAVTLNTVTGNITMNGAALAAGAIVTFTLNNSALTANDQLVCTHHSAGTVGPYLITGRATGSGTGTITVRNTSAGSLSEAIVIKFFINKAVVA